MNKARFFAALWLSEAWYLDWIRTRRLHRRARAVVLYDRVLCGEMERHERYSADALVSPARGAP